MTEVNLLPRRSIWRSISDRNPFYLLSALCMLFGCVALTNSSSWTSVPLPRLLILTVTLNVYEFLLIGLALFLIVKRGLRRDGSILLILEAFFLVDVTFLNSELFSASLKVGLIVNLILFALAIVKIALIFRGLGISFGSGAFAVAVIELAMLFAAPGVFKRLSSGNGALSPLAIYGTWWAIGLLPVLATFLMRDRHYFPEPQRAAYRRSTALVGLFVILPVVSLLAHVCTSNWIYKVRWYSPNLAPLLLGLAIAIGAYDAHVSTLGRRMRWHFVLPILAIVLAAPFPSSLQFHAGPVWFSPLRCTLLGAMLVYAFGFLLHRHILFAWAACVCFGAAGMGLSTKQILDNFNSGAKQTYTTSKRLWPTTMNGWGIVSMVASFALLALGALVSLRKRAPYELLEETKNLN